MKKLVILGAALVLTFSMGTAVFAASTNAACRNTHHTHTSTEKCGYIDEDDDGVCDNCLNDDTDCRSHLNCSNSDSSTSNNRVSRHHHSTGHGHRGHH